jgi:hypothetical protein
VNPKTKKIIIKLHFSLVVLFTVIGGAFIFLAAPIEFYDQYIVKRDTACWQKSYAELKKPEASSDKNVAPTKEQEIFEVERYYIQEQCNLIFDPTDLKTLEFLSKDVIRSNNPSPSKMFRIGFFFFGISLLLVLLKKWFVWLLKD